MYTCIHTCMYMHIYTCVYTYIYIYIYIHTHIQSTHDHSVHDDSAHDDSAKLAAHTYPKVQICQIRANGDRTYIIRWRTYIKQRPHIHNLLAHVHHLLRKWFMC